MNSTVRDFFLSNLPLKAVSLVLAFLLWNQVASLRTAQRTVTVPLVIVNMPENLEISNDYLRQVDVEVRSRGGDLDTRELSAVVNLTDAHAGDQQIVLTPQHISHPRGVEIVKVTPAQVSLRLEATRTKHVPVRVQTSGEAADGFEVTAVEAEPEEVLVAGPESVVEALEVARTGGIDIAGRQGSIQQEIFVDLDDGRLRIEGSGTVTAKLTIEEKRRRFRIRGVKVAIDPPSADVRLFTSRLQLNGTVPLSFNQTLEAGRFQAVVNVTDLAAASSPSHLIPQVLIPDEYQDLFRLDSTSPATVQVQRTR